jgi:hypothetical protein
LKAIPVKFGGVAVFLDDRGADRERSLREWREAARLVAVRWTVFLEAPPESRQMAFASYASALDAEELAAGTLAAANAAWSGPSLFALRQTA